MKIAIAGAAGRMGFNLIRAAATRPGVSLVGAVDRSGAGTLGRDLGEVAGLAPLGVAVTDSPAEAAAGADVWVDFSTPDATRAAIAEIPGAGVKAAIIGTTGLDAAAEAAIAAASKKIAVVRSGNFSRGVTVLAAMVQQLAAKLGPDWDIEIVETHHRRKVDAPSGTALLLGEAAAAGRGRTLHDLRIAPREGIVGSRPEGGIGFSSLRAGGVVGDHEVIFASENETLRFAHHAADRKLFAEGALDAAAWAMGQKPGLYSMRDVLSL